MTNRTRSFARQAFLWFCAGLGLDLQGRLLDHVLDKLATAVTWLSFLQ